MPLVLNELEGLAKGGWVRDTVCDAAKQALKILKNIDSAAVKFVTTKGSSFKSTTCFEEENNFVCFVGQAISIYKSYFNCCLLFRWEIMMIKYWQLV